MQKNKRIIILRCKNGCDVKESKGIAQTIQKLKEVMFIVSYLHLRRCCLFYLLSIFHTQAFV